MAQKFITRQNGLFKQVEASVVSTGAADAGKVVALNSAGVIDASMLPPGVGDEVNILPAYEALSAGSFVNVFFDSTDSKVKVRLADNSNARAAHGFVLDAFAAAADAEVFSLGETNSGKTGLTPGVELWLGTAGGVISSPLVETLAANIGKISQRIGVSKSATEILTAYSEPVVL
jgi:hypothetical protein